MTLPTLQLMLITIHKDPHAITGIRHKYDYVRKIFKLGSWSPKDTNYPMVLALLLI